MKRFLPVLAFGCSLAAVILPPAVALATDFSLEPHDPGPGHRQRTFWWKFNKANWELCPPDKYELLGGGTLTLRKAGDGGTEVICRESIPTERELLLKKDPAAQAAYCRTLLPSQITDVQMVSQAQDPLPVNGLTNFEVVFSYNLSGIVCRATYMVSQGNKGEGFTAVIVASQEKQSDLYNAYQRLMATARIARDEPSQDASGQYVSHGMLNR